MEDKDLNILTDESIVKMAQEGSNTAYEYLINKYKALTKNKAKIYFIAGGDNEDVIQEGMIGIFKAIRDFDEKKEASFRTFAELCINRQIINAIKHANRQKHQILNESISLNPGNSNKNNGEGLCREISAEAEEAPENFMLLKEVAEHFNAEGSRLFSPFEKRVWQEMLKGKNYKEIAGTLHRPSKAVDNAIQRIKKKFKKLLDD